AENQTRARSAREQVSVRQIHRAHRRGADSRRRPGQFRMRRAEARSMKRFAGNFSLACALLALLAPRGFAAEAKKIVFAYSSIGSMATGVWVAKDSGAFDKYGIPADIIFISSGPVVVQSLIGGDLQVGSAASNAVINAVLNGAPIVAIGGTANRPYHRLFVQPEINRIEDLKGKTLGVTPPSQPKILLPLVDLGIPYSMNMLAISREMLKREPDTAEKIARAYAEGVAFMNQNKERSLKIFSKYAHTTDPKQLEIHY